MMNIFDSMLGFLSVDKTQPPGNTLEKAINYLSDSGKEIIERHHLSDEQAETLYAVGFHMYQKADYMKAKAIFSYIMLGTIGKKVDTRVLMALGACYQAEKEYAHALTIYKVCVALGMAGMEIHFYSAECLIYLRKKDEAIQKLNYFLTSPKAPPPPIELLNKARALLQLLNNDKSKL